MDLMKYGLAGLRFPMSSNDLPSSGVFSQLPTPPNQGQAFGAKEQGVMGKLADVILMFMVGDLVHVEALFGRLRKREREDFVYDLLDLLNSDFGNFSYERRGSSWLRTWEHKDAVVILGNMQRGLFL